MVVALDKIAKRSVEFLVITFFLKLFIKRKITFDECSYRRKVLDGLFAGTHGLHRASVRLQGCGRNEPRRFHAARGLHA
jgi:hypothetical protein